MKAMGTVVGCQCQMSDVVVLFFHVLIWLQFILSLDTYYCSVRHFASFVKHISSLL